MILRIGQVALVVHDYDEAKQFYCNVLGFECLEDTQRPTKRWIRLQAPGQQGSEILLSKAVNNEQQKVVGNQAGGRVLFFMYTNDFEKDYEKLSSKGVVFEEKPRNEAYGKVVVFKDLYGNRIDLIERK